MQIGKQHTKVKLKPLFLESLQAVDEDLSISLSADPANYTALWLGSGLGYRTYYIA